MAQNLKYSMLPALIVCACMLSGCARLGPLEGVAPRDYTLTVTGYCKCGKCTGWERNWYGKPVYNYGPNKGKRKQVGVTASGTKARPGVIAADTTVFPFGTVMYVPGYGYGRVEDRGGDIKGNAIDLYFRSHSRAVAWGRRSLKVRVWLPPK